MKLLTTFLIVYLISAQDTCREYSSFERCVQSFGDQCRWNVQTGTCTKTSDYLFGCSPNLNKQACIKQLGTPSGTIAQCRFMQYCEYVSDFSNELCSNSLSKYACLGVTNINQRCIWTKYQCKVIDGNENVQSNFITSLYSASVCSLINNYFIIHSSILWKFQNYYPNLLVMAENQVKEDVGIFTQLNESYADPKTVKLANNYVDSNNFFTFYRFQTTKSSSSSNLKIADRKREGCIAVEIADDDDFQLLIQKQLPQIGYNHIYCRYLLQYNSYHIFLNGQCTQIQYPNDLLDQNYIKNNQITCNMMGYQLCSVFNYDNKCSLHKPNEENQEIEYSCIANQNTQQLQPSEICPTQSYSASLCNSSKYCYVDTNTYKCSNVCPQQKTKSQCESSGCKWSDKFQSLTEKILEYQFCEPSLSCDQPGIDKIYCSQLGSTCSWNSITKQCYTVQGADLDILNCSDASNLMTCASIRRSDQLCFWSISTCYNVRDYTYLSAILSFSSKHIMNKNLCISQTDDNFEYFPNKTCQKVSDISSAKCSTQRIFNRQACFSISSQACYWNLNQQCQEFTNTSQLCSTLTSVNPIACQLAQQPMDSMKQCIYNEQNNSCLEVLKTDISCNLLGISKSICLNLVDKCQWINSKCQSISQQTIDQYRCDLLIDVSSAVCQSYSRGFCQFEIYKGQYHCFSNSIQQTNCDKSYNGFVCQNSTAQCYFSNNACSSFVDKLELLTQLQCENNFLSKSACLAITTINQPCYWDTRLNKCRLLQSSMTTCNQYNALSNISSCSALETQITKILTNDAFCEVNASHECVLNIDPISGCGTDQVINIHRCVAYTSERCYFDQYRCWQTAIGSLENIILNKISCKQANQSLCNLVTTPQQYCIFINSAVGLQNDKKCMSTTQTNSDCDSMKQGGNPNYCSQAQDLCMFMAKDANGNEQTKCQVPSQSSFPPSPFDCNNKNLGLSRKACIEMTIGVCVFLSSNQCVPFSYSVVELINCSQLNQLACQTNTYLKCQWDLTTKICTQNMATDCPTSTRPDANQYTSWALCSYSEGSDCIGNLSACSTTLPNPMPCDVIGTNKQSCLSDQEKYVCEFYDGKCRYYQPRLCEGATTRQQCYTIITPGQYCVFQNQKCYNSLNPIECDIYQNTNYNFCTQFPDCVWDKIKYQCTNQYKYKELLQNLPNVSGGKTCVEINTAFDCIFSITSSCKFDYATSKCVQVNPTDSILYQGDFYNIKSCVSQSKQYTLTKTGGFCSSQDIKCSDLLTKQLCTTHINDSLQCFWLSTCQSKLSTQLTCTDIQGLSVNFPLCKALQGNSCIYDLNNNKCKPSINPITNCSDPLVTSFVQCAYLVRASCVFSSNVCSASGAVFDQNLNKYGCTSLLNDFYYFNDVTWKCNQIPNGDNLIGCENLNKDACIQITSLYYCRWNNGQCQEDNKMQNCTDLNYKNCLLLEKTSEICYWKNNKCNKADSDYPFSNEKRSLGYCSQKIIDDSNGLMNQNQDECEYSLAINDNKLGQFKYIQLSQCSGLGLNKLACQQNTLEQTCVWDDGCQEAILDQHLCVQAATMNTCLKLRTNQQFCQWNKSVSPGQCVLTTAPTSCATAFTLFSCQSVLQEQCQWDVVGQSCKRISSFNQCDNTLSKLACTQVFSPAGSQLCTFTNNQCQKLTSDPVVCSQIADFQTCMNFTKILIFCQWINNKCTTFPKPENKLFCFLIPQGVNLNVCKTFSEDLCYFNSKSNMCSNKFNSDYFGQNTYLEQFNQKLSVTYLQQFQSIIYSAKCESLSAQQCTQSRVKNQYCQLSSNICITITNLNVPCNNLNIYACINSTQNGCFWKQDQCNTLGNISLNELTNVNSIVCSAQTTSTKTHLYVQNSCYATTELSQAKCIDQGINRITCLQLNDQCTFVGNKCQNFVKTTQANCSDYQSVTQYVCQQIQDVACQKKVEGCDNFVQVAGMKIDSLSKLACLRYTEFPVYWNGSCQQYISTKLQCGSSTLVNALVCVTIETNRTPCIYDSVNFVCTPNFNKYSIKCTSPGLNVYGCAMVQTQACVFNDKCQEYTLTDQQCQNIKNVNSMACQIQLIDSCYYDQSMLQCSPTPIQPLCSLSGLNLAGCGTNSICSWNNDLSKCQCQSEISSNKCYELNVTQCTGLCTYIKGQCVQSSCESQPISNCSGTLRGLKCYISNNQCFSASTCYDMYNTQCQNYGCDQAGNQCVPSGSSQVCQYLKDCNNTKCLLQQGVCRPLLCSDLSQDQCYQSDDCYFSNNLCHDLLGCLQLSNDPDQCNLKQCNYQKYHIMSSQLYCTSQYCDVYGASNNICNGNEMNFQACVLNGLKCQTCESITDVCLCQKSKDICIYSENKCQSILCQEMQQSVCGLTENRCYWSNKLNICAKKCEKIIDQSDCEFRTDECYFNENTKLCYTGSITIPDVTNINDTTETFGAILIILIHIIF